MILKWIFTWIEGHVDLFDEANVWCSVDKDIHVELTSKEECKLSILIWKKGTSPNFLEKYNFFVGKLSLF